MTSLAGRLTGISSLNGTTEIMKASYTLDSVGNRTKATQSVETVATNAYYQDNPTYRLTQSGATSSSADTEYYYDLVGNRHTSVDNRTATKGTTTYVTDEANRLTDQFGPKPSSQGGGRYHDSYYFDADGNLVRMEKDQKDVTLYSYDAANRLLQVTPTAGLPTVYGYNGDGQRVRLQDSTGTTFFIYDGAEVLAEVADSGQLSVAYSRMPSGRLISQLRSGKTYWYHLDGLGSTIALTDGTNRVVNQYAYDEWGNKGSSTESVFNRYTFTGQAWDASAGLYNYKARYYNPQIGRFLTQDTYKGSPWKPWTQHLYAYVGNNPVNYVDPTGHKVGSVADNLLDGSDGGSGDSGGTTPAESSSGQSLRGPDGNLIIDRVLACERKPGCMDLEKVEELFEKSCLLALLIEGYKCGIPMMMGTVSPAGFTSGALFETTVAYGGKEIGVLADVVTEGTTLTLKNLAIYPKGAEVANSVGPKAFLALRDTIANLAKSQGFEKLIIQGVRMPNSTSANPGKIVEIIIDLLK